MPRRFREEKVPLGSLAKDRSRLYEPFTTALVATMTGEVVPEERTVTAREVRIPEGFEAPPEHVDAMLAAFVELRRTREEMMEPIAVLERADGSLWAYDDAALMAAYHVLAPDARVACLVIGKDPR